MGHPTPLFRCSQVTHGHSPTFTARECEVAEVAFDAREEMIHCRTAPGGGRDQAWTVHVGGQASAPSEATSSYAPPILHNVSVAPGEATATHQIHAHQTRARQTRPEAASTCRQPPPKAFILDPA